MRAKAYMALVVATGMLNSQLPARCEEAPKNTSSLIREIANDTKRSADTRAYLLLLLASRFMEGANESELNSFHSSIQNFSMPDSFQINRYVNRGNPIDGWAERLCGELPSDALNLEQRHPIRHATLDRIKNVKLARSAIHKALSALKEQPVTSTHLMLYFVASLLSQKSEDIDDARRCEMVLQSHIHEYEQATTIDAQPLETVVSILNMMSDRYLYVPIPMDAPKVGGAADHRHETELAKSNPDKTAFQKSERLKLQAAAIADRLPPENHVRRKSHRDLAVWYMQLGKSAEAEREKQTLFKLVGIADDKILYPQSAGCAGFVWWKTEPVGGVECGMG